MPDLVYLITNMSNGKLYVGKTSKTLDERWRVHVQHTCESHYRNQLITKAIRKYGVDSFKREVLEECRDNDHASEREIHWISELRAQDRSIGYNMTSGGEGTPGHVVSEETRRRLSERIVSVETRQKMSAAMHARLSRETDEQRRKRTSKQAASITGEKNPFFGKDWGRHGPHSSESKRKMSAAKSGRVLTDEHKARIALGVKKIDPALLGSNKGMCWPVMAYDLSGRLVMIFEGFDDASKGMGVHMRELRRLSKSRVPVGSVLLVKGPRTSREDVTTMKKTLQALPGKDCRLQPWVFSTTRRITLYLTLS